jgi:hypothetical protein
MRRNAVIGSIMKRCIKGSYEKEFKRESAHSSGVEHMLSMCEALPGINKRKQSKIKCYHNETLCTINVR